MNKKILVVDDDTNILSSITRNLHGKYELSTASSAHDALDILKKKSDFALVLTDYKMPLVNGLELLQKVRESYPATIRMMLTGQADMEAVVKIINQGSIFRFLTKPCYPELLIKNINDAIEQYRLVHAEKELLSKTLSGCIQVMTDILVLSKPQAFNRSIRIKTIVKKILSCLSVENSWQIEIAAMLSQIGCVTIPDIILDKIYHNHPIPPEDKIIFLLHTKTSSEIINKIPRLEEVANIIAYQEKYYNGTGFPNNNVKEDEIPLGARILRVAMDYDQIMQIETATSIEALNKLKKRENWYDVNIILALEKGLAGGSSKKQKYIFKKVLLKSLNEKMYLAASISSASGMILGEKNQRITKTLIITLKNYARNNEIKEPIDIFHYVE